MKKPTLKEQVATLNRKLDEGRITAQQNLIERRNLKGEVEEKTKRTEHAEYKVEQLEASINRIAEACRSRLHLISPSPIPEEEYRYRKQNGLLDCCDTVPMESDHERKLLEYMLNILISPPGYDHSLGDSFQDAMLYGHSMNRVR